MTGLVSRGRSGPYLSRPAVCRGSEGEETPSSPPSQLSPPSLQLEGWSGPGKSASSVSTVPTKHGTCQSVLPHPQRPGPGRDGGHAKDGEEGRGGDKERNEASHLVPGTSRPVPAGRDSHTGLAETPKQPCEVPLSPPFWRQGHDGTERLSDLLNITELLSTEPATLAPESRSLVSREPGPGGRGRDPV